MMDWLKRLVVFLWPRILLKFPSGATPSLSADWGLFALMNAANKYAQNPITVATGTSVANTLTAAQLVDYGVILRTGTPGGGVADTLATATELIAQMGGIALVPLDGTYSEPLRILNSTGQTITITTSTGLTLTGTMTIADGAYRDFYLTPTSATTLTVLNVGGGTI